MLGKTENRQVWIDFPYPKEIFLALHFDRYCWEIKKRQYLLQRLSESLVHSYNQETVYPSDFFTD